MLRICFALAFTLGLALSAQGADPIKLWPGKSEQQKAQLADAVARNVMSVLHYGEAAVSVSFEEVEPAQWASQVYQPDIVCHPERLYKKPGYSM